MSLHRRGVIYHDLDCLMDMDSAKYEAYGSQSQAEVPWTYQPHYAKVTIYYGVVTVFLAMIKYIWYKIDDSFYKRGRKIRNPVVSVIAAYCRSLGYSSIPSRICYFTSLPVSAGSSVYLIASSLYLFCYCLVPHFWYRGCRGFGSPPLAVRAGLMATALTPFVYILSGKTNLISFLTGVSYEKLNYLHQYVGVAAFVLSIIHTIPFIYQDLAEGGAGYLRGRFASQFAYYSGIPPLILLGFLCTLSKSFFRKKFYEGFLHLHWIMGIAYFATLWWHIDKSLGMEDYMYAALAFWASQLIYRWLVKTAFRPTVLFKKPKEASLKILTENIFEITISDINAISWKPGQHCYIRFIGNRILDNHPFSIMSNISTDENLKFMVTAKKGLTREMYNQLQTHSSLNKLVLIDGPYGGAPRDFRGFDTLTLASTGTGIASTLPFLSSAASHIQNFKEKGMYFTLQKINFVWIIKSPEQLLWISEELRSSLEAAEDYIEFSVYVAGNSANDSSELGEKNHLELSKIPNSSSFSITQGKPYVPALMKELVSTFGPKNMVVCCGSHKMNREVRDSVSDMQKLIFNSDTEHYGIDEIYLHTEEFNW